VILVAGLITAALAQAAQAQTEPPADPDPVSRAIASIESSINPRAEAAGKVIAASKLIRESETAERLGERRRALEAAKEASLIAGSASAGTRSPLLDELNLAIRARLEALDPEVMHPPETRFATRRRFVLQNQIRERLKTYTPLFTEILRDADIPEGLIAVALVESGFDPLALSPKGARGIWQFMPATARRYGLRVTHTVDDRTNPEQSTRAAARYLRDLYSRFADWKLALAAYNSGEQRVERVIRKTGIRDFDEIARRGLLPLETRRYVRAVLAAWAHLDNRFTRTASKQKERANR
jgi:soluble lytic murein transglycosylase-like protein